MELLCIFYIIIHYGIIEDHIMNPLQILYNVVVKALKGYCKIAIGGLYWELQTLNKNSYS